jgi:virginiamycin A acetyltransferase
MLQFKWWDLPIEEINRLIPLLHNNDLEYVKEKVKKKLL